MNKSFKRTLQVSGIIAGIFGVLFIGFMMKLKSEMNKMSPLETKELIGNITSIKDTYVNMYLIKDKESYIAIDAGNKIDAIRENFKELKIHPDKVSAVFLTHTDFDHVAALELFQKATIYFSKEEEQMINGSTSRFFLVGNRISTKEYLLLEDGQVLSLENTQIQGILTPGHTPGSMCYLINNKYLFTGDALSLKNGKIARFNEIFNMNTEKAVKSMEKPIHIPGDQYILSAHYGYSDSFASSFLN